jgi:AhpD family alkylhydroperoxidase
MTTATLAPPGPDAPPRFEQEIGDVLGMFAAPGAAIEAHGISPQLFHLVKLRASQINRCAHCVMMHTREARADGETSERLDRLVVWDHVKDFTPAERAALAWTEALTVFDHNRALGPLRSELRAHFSEEQIAALTAGVALINLWNRIGVSRH